MLCQFERLVYPQRTGALSSGGYMVAVYKPCEKIIDSKGNAVTQIKAVGYALPIAEQIRYDMDMLTNFHVREAYNNLLLLLDKMNFKFGTYIWDPVYKGLDDYIFAQFSKRA